MEIAIAEEEIGHWRQTHNEELYDTCFSPSSILFVFGATVPSGPGPPHSRAF